MFQRIWSRKESKDMCNRVILKICLCRFITINFLFFKISVYINELGNKYASRAIDAVPKHLERTKRDGLSMQITKIDISETDAADILHTSKSNGVP